MPKLLQINVTSNWGATGRIAEECCVYAAKEGWECFVAYGRYSNPSQFQTFKIGAVINVYEHYVENRIFDNDGLASRVATHRLIRYIKRISPDIIHIHNIHDHWLNYYLLFRYLNGTDIKVVWTFHDFWGMTGGCPHFFEADCKRWQTECECCPYLDGKIFPLIRRTNFQFRLKKSLFQTNHNLHIVAVSDWVGHHIKQSFLCDSDIRVITNGIDVSIFKPTPLCHDVYISRPISDRLMGKFVILAVSSQWKSGAKGLEDYLAMSKLLSNDEVIVLVGLPREMINALPSNMVGIERTNNQKELAALYTRADVVTSFSSAETFGLTIVEGFACGTPAVVYNNTALPSLISEGSGFVVRNGDYKEAYQAARKIKILGKHYFSDRCIALARECYNKDKCFNAYVTLYKSMLR